MQQRYQRFAVVKNHLGRYAIWPATELDELSSKWQPVGFEGSQEEAREYVREHWPQIREWSDEELDQELT